MALIDGEPAFDLGFYGPDSLTWRLSRERVMLFGGLRALLLQLAHPLVAAGVAHHSSFRTDPIARLRRTLDGTLAVVFGSTRHAAAAAGRVNSAHRSVHGTLPEAAGCFPAGTPYSATDPELLAWVHATLVDTTLEVYPLFVGPLTEGELARAYEESKVAGRMFGVPDELLPADLAAFRSYMDGMLSSDRISISPFQRALADDVLAPHVRFVPRLAFMPLVAITTALLPPKLRAGYGLELTRSRKLAFAGSRALVRGILPVLPRVLRDQPQARDAIRRVRKGR